MKDGPTKSEFALAQEIYFKQVERDDALGALRDGDGAKAAQRQPGGDRRLEIIAFADDVQPVLDDAWLIEDLIPEEGLGVAYGTPGSGKTFVALDLALTIAGGGTNWRGKHVQTGAVVYFGMEGGRAFRNRIAAWASENGEAPHFYRSGETLDLRSTLTDAEAVIREAQSIAKAGPPVKLIVVDTLNRALGGGNENAPEDMGAFIATCEVIRKTLRCFLLVIHHSGKDEARGMRGHSSLLGAVDTELHLWTDKPARTMTVTKQRDGADGEEFGYTLRSVFLGRSPRGKDICSCVVDAADAAPRTPRLGAAMKRALEALIIFLGDHGEPCPGGTGWPGAGSRQTVSVELFLPFLAERMTAEDPNDRRKTARRALNSLVAKGVVAINDGRVWLVRA